MEKSKRKSIIEKAVVVFIALIVAGLLILFLSDVFIPFIRLEIARDIEGAKDLLIAKGFAGYATVPVVEALQMVVIFIPAEFIQLTSGMAYPWWLTLILCDIGVMLGCSIIYFLVNILSFKGDIFNKQDRIERYEHMAKSRSTVVFMYLLFIMPVIPFGAICYYGSGKHVPYPRFLLTCATGVIPSILTSVLMGTAVREFIANSLPVWALVLMIVAAGAILFTLLAFVLHKYFFKAEKGKPNPWLISLSTKILLTIMALKTRYNVINAEGVKKLDGAFIYLANHHSWRDMGAIFKIDPSKTVVSVINEYYFRLPFAGKILRNMGCIGKKMFYPDIKCVQRMISAVREGYPLMLFPEGQLSTDGGPSYIDGKLSVLCKKMGVPIVTVEIRNNYFISPKWRRGNLRGRCDVEVKRIIGPEELKAMDADELTGIIRRDLSYNEFKGPAPTFRSKRKAEGLREILYMCPHCGGTYTNVSYKNTLECTACGKKYVIGDDYRFKDGDIPDIFEYYKRIMDIERRGIDSISLGIPVDAEIYKDGVKKIRKDKGVFRLDSGKVSYRSDMSGLYFEYGADLLEDIAYSAGKEFEMYHKGELYYFYPSKDDSAICARVALLYRLIKEKRHE